ncbi:MAG: putative bifunctional diguanylate cyclase/phosphodiesterase [Nitrospiraceae bacterium]
MPSPLRLLILEDCAADAELMLEHLREAGFEPDYQRVWTETDYLASLEKSPDLILSDYSLPQFDGRRALRLLKERGLDIPFIIVSGCIGEEVAVECMKEGAADYLLKDRLARLGQAVSRSLDRKRLEEERLLIEKQRRHEAFHDALTGLPNRALLLERLERCLLRGQRDEPYIFALLFLDLDGFKVVNDSLGHAAGDRLLIEVSARLLRHVRSGDTVARLGDEGFALLLDDLKSVNNATRVADRIQRELGQPFTVNEQAVFITASIGIATSTTGYEQPPDMLRDAGVAMYRARDLGKGRFVMFDQAMHSQAMARLKLEADLRRAVEGQEFLLFYQPVVSFATGRISGFEALLRWQHPERGLLTPDEFLAVAEEIDVVIPLGEWVLREACRQSRIWQERYPGIRPLTMGVNVSGRQFSQSDLAGVVERALLHTGLDGSSLKLEITETVMMDNAESATRTLLALQARGIETCMDDFGTGYSSLSYLQRFPVNILKIDRSFVSRMGGDDGSLEIVRTIITLAHQLGRVVIAEGVETTKQLALLKSLHCEYGQGHLFGKPLAPDTIVAWLAADHHW